MDKFWENYITTRPVDSKGAFDAFKQMNKDPRSTIPGPRNMADGGRIAFNGGGSPLQRLRQEIVNSMRPYAPGDVTEDLLQ